MIMLNLGLAELPKTCGAFPMIDRNFPWLVFVVGLSI